MVKDGMAYYSVGIEDGLYEVRFDVDTQRYRLVNRETGREVFADARAFFIEDLDLDWDEDGE